MIEEFQTMEVMEIPPGGSAFPIDLQGEEGLVSARIAGGFEQGHRSIFESAQEGAGVVNGNGLHFAGETVLAFLDEGLRHRRYFGDGSVQPKRHVDVVREQVAGHAAAGYGCIQTP